MIKSLCNNLIIIDENVPPTTIKVVNGPEVFGFAIENTTGKLLTLEIKRDEYGIINKLIIRNND